MKRHGRRNKIRACGAVLASAVLAAAFCLCACAPTDDGRKEEPAWQAGELRVHFLDVGQGDCTVIELPDGKKIMIDGGDGSAENNRKIADSLDDLGIGRLDEVILTHSDRDHSGGIESVLDEVEVSGIYLPYKPTLGSDEVYFSLCRKAEAEVPAVKYAPERYDYIRGDTYDYFLTFLWPRRFDAAPEGDANYYSAVLWLEYEGLSILFAGDMTKETEDELMREYALASDIFDWDDMHVSLESTEVLKVAHHGSATSSGEAWLRLLSPEAAVISVGADNGYGHPSDEVVAALHAAMPEGEVYRTDECGDILLTSAGGGAYTFSYQ